MDNSDPSQVASAIANLLRLERRRRWTLDIMWLPVALLIVLIAYAVKLSMLMQPSGSTFGAKVDTFLAVLIVSLLILVPIGLVVGLALYKLTEKAIVRALKELPAGWSRDLRLVRGVVVGNVRVFKCDSSSIELRRTPFSWNVRAIASSAIVASLLFFLALSVQTLTQRGFSIGSLITITIIIGVAVVAELLIARIDWIRIESIDGGFFVRSGSSMWGLPIPWIGYRSGLRWPVVQYQIVEFAADTFEKRAYTLTISNNDGIVAFSHTLPPNAVGYFHGQVLRDGLHSHFHTSTI